MEVVLVIWIMCGITCAIIAKSKGRSGLGWFFVGAGMSIFGIILIACLPKVGEQPVAMTERERSLLQQLEHERAEAQAWRHAHADQEEVWTAPLKGGRS